jgi:hypothetical protein
MPESSLGPLVIGVLELLLLASVSAVVFRRIRFSSVASGRGSRVEFLRVHGASRALWSTGVPDAADRARTTAAVASRSAGA